MSTAATLSFFSTPSIQYADKPSVQVAPSITALDPLPACWSEEIIEEWVQRRPTALLQLLINGELDAADTALAIEVATRALSETRIVPILVRLIEDDAALVREAAIYGLAKFPVDPRVKAAIQAHMDPLYESSAAVREAAADALIFLDSKG